MVSSPVRISNREGPSEADSEGSDILTELDETVEEAFELLIVLCEAILEYAVIKVHADRS